jgi:hypothetical protein
MAVACHATSNRFTINITTTTGRNLHFKKLIKEKLYLRSSSLCLAIAEKNDFTNLFEMLGNDSGRNGNPCAGSIEQSGLVTEPRESWATPLALGKCIPHNERILNHDDFGSEGLHSPPHD